jgi:microcystin-dependent protein
MKNFIFFLFMLVTSPVWAQSAGLMPNAVQSFFDNNGNPLSSGTVDTYIVGTTTRKTTWQDAGETIPNTNPIVLNAAGRAIIYGDGVYRQVVKDRNGNIIWDAVTSAVGTGGSATQFGDGTAVGTVLQWSGIVAPSHYVFAYGQEFSRVTYAALYTAITLTSTVNCTSASNILTGLSDTQQIPIGAPVEATCVAGGTTVTAKTGSTVTVSNNANVTTSVSAIFFPWGNGNGTSTFNGPDLRGRALVGRDNLGGTAASRLTLAYYGANPDGVGAAGGSQSQTLVLANLPAYTPAGTIVSTQGAHSHFIANGDTSATPLNSSSYETANNNIGSTAAYSLAGTATVASIGLTTTATPTITSTLTGTAQGGTSTPFSVVPPSITFNYIIKITPDTSISTLNVVTSLGGMTGDITCSGVITCSGQNITASGIGSGDVAGPGSATNGNMAVFDGVTGKLLSAVSGTNVVADVVGTGQPGFLNTNWFSYNNYSSQNVLSNFRAQREANFTSSPSTAVIPTIWGITGIEPFVGNYEWTIVAEQHNRNLFVTGGQNVALNGTNFKELSGTNGIYATTAASGTGATATVTYTGPAIASVGHNVLISGMTPSGYNGQHLVTASSAGSVSFASAQTGPQTVAGTIKGMTIGPSWGANLVCEDQTGENDPVAACVGVEVDIYHHGNSTDNNKTRIGIQIAAGSYDNGVSHVAYGLLMNNAAGVGSIIDRGIALHGSYGIGLDSTDGTFGTAPIFLAASQKIVFDGNTGGTYFRSLNYGGGELIYGTQNGSVFQISDDGYPTIGITNTIIFSRDSGMNIMKLLSATSNAEFGSTVGFTQITSSTGIIMQGDSHVNGTLSVSTLPTSAGGGGLFVCIDTSGNMYKKATCP